MTDKLEALKAAALAIGHERWVQDGSSVNTEDYRIANGEMCCDHIGCFESVNGESPHAKYVAAASPAVVLELLAALEEKDQCIKEFERITEGVDQLAIDGGWTARGMSEYATARDAENQDLMLTVGRLRVERADLEQRLQQPIKLPDCVLVLLNHIEDVVDEYNWGRISVEKWNAVTMLSRDKVEGE